MNQKNALGDMFEDHPYIDSIFTEVTLHEHPSGRVIDADFLPQYKPREKKWTEEDESNKRMDIIGRNGNEGTHYDEEEV
jgi:hypothetical protein